MASLSVESFRDAMLGATRRVVVELRVERGSTSGLMS
jgi:hypothetical protein